MSNTGNRDSLAFGPGIPSEANRVWMRSNCHQFSRHSCLKSCGWPISLSTHPRVRILL